MQQVQIFRAVVFPCLALSCCGVARAAPHASLPREPVLLVASPSRNLTFAKTSRDVVVAGFSRNELRKFLLIAHGPEVTSVNYQVGSSFLGEIGNDGVVVTNPPFDVGDIFAERRRTFQKQSDALQRCVRYRVFDANSRGLRLPRQQIGCSIERVDDNTVLAAGGFCFFAIDVDSSFVVDYEVNPECVDVDFLRQNDISPKDFFAFAGYYVAGDASGTSLDLTPLDAARLHVSIEPWQSQLPISADLGTTESRWPVEIEPDVHAGSLKIVLNGDGTPILENPLLVKNDCAPVCRDGTCPSRCDFNVAFGAFMQLQELVPGQSPRLLDAWYTGGVVPPRWTGFLPSNRVFSYPFFVPGKRYRVVSDLSYPDTYFRIFRDGFEQLLIDLDGFSAGLSLAGTGTLPSLNPLGSQRERSSMLPIISLLSGLLGGGMTSLWMPLEALKNMIKYEDWPPYYERLVHGQSAASIVMGQNQTMVSVDFTVTNAMPNEAATLSEFVLRRQSNILSSYERRVDALPGVGFH